MSYKVCLIVSRQTKRFVRHEIYILYSPTDQTQVLGIYGLGTPVFFVCVCSSGSDLGSWVE